MSDKNLEQRINIITYIKAHWNGKSFTADSTRARDKDGFTPYRILYISRRGSRTVTFYLQIKSMK